MRSAGNDLIQTIISSARPKIPAFAGLTQEEEGDIFRQVEHEVKGVVETLSPETERSCFEMDKNISKGIEAKINVETFKANPLKAKAATSYAKKLFKQWEWLIRRSEGFALLLQTRQKLVKEAKR